MTSNAYKLSRLVQASACTSCRLCADICPVVAASADGRLSGLYRINELKKLHKQRSPFLKKIFGDKSTSPDQLKNYSDTVFKCTLCGNCEEVCPVGIRLTDLWVSIRQDMVESGAYPEKIDMIRDNVNEENNVFGEDNEERSEWVEDMIDEPEDGLIKDRADIVYFPGCVSAFFPLAQKVPIALAEIMAEANIDFTLLGEDEWCCGFPLMGAGVTKGLKESIEHNVEAVKSKKATKVLFSCPSCYQMWLEHYPPDFELIHTSRFLGDLINSGDIELKRLPMTVTYHDPCDLGRGTRTFEEPRSVIRSIPGVKLVEMAATAEYSQCCGGGGNLEMIDAELAGQVSKQKIDDILETGAEAVVSACQQCVRNMTAHVRRNKVENLKVMDITELVHSALF